MEENQIPKTYNAKKWEDKLYALWEKSGFFNPDVCIQKGVTASDAKPFSIVLPPPNVTGTLHTGSACMLAIEDLVVRFKRMQGFRTLWIPGTDHAAIATQSKVEKIIFKEEGKTRHDLGRGELLKRIEAFAKKSHDTIVHQTKKIGSSLDWSREAYTLDEKRNFAVRTAFKKMFNDGIIYRGERIVNWDPKMQTTVSDDEIEYVERNSPFYYFQYGPFVIGTVRPETKFGNKYVVVHPDDERYKEYKHGQKIDLEWMNGPITATIIKDEAGDMKFGSGVMTITPAHSRVDFEIAQRHNLDIEQVIDDQGILMPIAQEFAGLEIKEAREKIVEKLKAKGLIVKVEEQYAHNMATNSRGGGIIEPQIKKQWWIDVNKEFQRRGKTVTLKALMQNAVRSGNIHILPERFEKVYFHWIDNLRDWCISRQIWYGHRIPVWYRGTEIYCGIETPEGADWEQDPDTLDTWFSSGLWTFSTLGWPDMEAKDFKTYHPTALLETGYDILFFWVARMILMSTYLLDTVPFETVYLHGLVRDEQGRKMSKSLDNIIDPLDVIEKHGADALRLSLVIGSTPGNDLRFSDAKIESFRNFANKLWNIGRYVGSQQTATSFADDDDKQPEPETPADHWILKRTDEVTKEITRLLENYQLSLAGETLRDFTWNEFADWYVEIHKVEKNDAILHFVFDTLLKLWHPFIPFITEALFQTFSQEKNDALLMVQNWPDDTISFDEKKSAVFDAVQKLIIGIRNARSIYHIDPTKEITLIVTGASRDLLLQNEELFKKLARIDTIQIMDKDVPQQCAFVQTGKLQAYIHLASLINIDNERARLEKEKESAQQYIVNIKKRLNDKSFTTKAPAHVIEQNEIALYETESKVADLTHALENLF